MEWLIGIGIIGLGYLWGKHKEEQGRRETTQRRSGYQNRYRSAAPTSPVAHTPTKPKKLNVKSVDISNVTLGVEQRAVYKVLEETGKNVYVTGKAGTGKSVLLQYFTEHTSKVVAVVAPTGVAALNVGGQTIHSFFKFNFDVQKTEEVEVDYKTREILCHIDSIVIDEISMVRVDMMEAINRKFQAAKNNDSPFGGVQLIAFGDLYQLPPVVADGELHRYLTHTYGGIYFFNAPVFKQSPLEIYELEHNRRQEDAEFRSILNSIRHGDNSPEVLDKINVRTEASIPEDGFITLAGINAGVNATNARKLASLSGQEHTYTAEISGDIKQSAFPTEKYLKLKVGAQVMMLKNDTEKPMRWANGTLGVVTSLTSTVIHVNIDGVEHSINKTVWEKVRYYYDPEERKLEKEVASTFTQFPMRLAWAITIHKSQGQTYQSVAVDLSTGAFAHGQTYVALSRCKSLEGLYLKSAIRPEDIIIDRQVIEFMEQAKSVDIGGLS